MASEINPTLTPTKSLTNFRFWCQKVLPLVYDDSLSYYEVLGKMVVQLNDVIDDVNADTENVLTLKDAFLELQTYVNNFFDDIDQLASYAERAEAAQTAANQSAINAASSASNASASSLAAMNARDAAVTAKEAAETSANTASTAATNANTKANEAAQSATIAQTAQESASQSATSASGSAINASTSASAAQQSFTLADAARTAAQEAANNAESAAELIDMDATQSDIGKAIIVKTVGDGKVTAYEFGEAIGGTDGIINTIESVPIASINDGIENSKVKKLVIDIEPVQSGSGDPSPDNIRPITGWTGANINKANGNLLKAITATSSNGITVLSQNDYSITLDGTALNTIGFTAARVKILPFQKYTIHIKGASSNCYVNINALNSDLSYNSQIATTSENDYTFTFETSDTYEYVIIRPTINVGNSVSNATIYFSINAGNKTGEFVENSVETYPIIFPSEASTIYGGNLTINEDGSGTLIANRKIILKEVIANAPESTSTGGLQSAGSGIYVYHVENAETTPSSVKNNKLISESLQTLTQNIIYNESAGGVIGCAVWWNNNIGIGTGNTDITSVSEFKTWWDENGGNIVYPLNTATTYTLTAQQVLTLLKGENNIWADTGDVEVTYYADSKSYIDDQNALVKALIAPILDSMVADTALVKNDFRIVNNTLYRVTTTIASGATLTVGTNVVATTIAEVVKPLLT